MSATADAPAADRRHQLHRRPGQRPVRGQALPVPVVPQPDRHDHRDRHDDAGPDQAGAGRHRLRRRRTSPTSTARRPGCSTTCRRSRRRRRSAGSRRTTAATPTTRSARATTCPARSPRPGSRSTRRRRPNPESTTPKNYTGGLYASDLFLEYYIPMIEKSAAFKDGGLIDITFDEGNPPFTYSGNSFNNANAYGPTLGDKPNASAGIAADAAGENLYGKNVHTEPTGPNSTLGTDKARQPALPRPGQQRLHRPAAGVHVDDADARRRPTACRASSAAGRATRPGARTDARRRRRRARPTCSTARSWPTTPAARSPTPSTRPGRAAPARSRPNTFVGTVSDTGPQLAGHQHGLGHQRLVPAGRPERQPGHADRCRSAAITLSAEGAPGFLAAGQTADPLYDADRRHAGRWRHRQRADQPVHQAGHDAPPPSTTTTAGCGRWRTSSRSATGSDHAKLPAGTVSGGLDGKGHLGFAAQPGLAPFGPDVFNNVPGKTHH